MSKEIDKEYTNDLKQWEAMYGDTPCRVIINEMFHFYNGPTFAESQTAELRNKLQDSEANRGLEEVENSDLRGANMKLLKELTELDSQNSLLSGLLEKERKEVERLEGENGKLILGHAIEKAERDQKIKQLQKENTRLRKGIKNEEKIWRTDYTDRIAKMKMRFEALLTKP